MPDFKRNETVIINPSNSESQKLNQMSFQSQISSIEYQRLCMMSQYSQLSQYKMIQYNQFPKYSQPNMSIPTQEEYLYQIYKCQQALIDQKYKTELCKSFISEGFCRYQFKCRFAHGIHDLINKTKDNNSTSTRSDKERNEQEFVSMEIERDETCCSTSVTNSVDAELNKSLNEEARNTSELCKSTLNITTFPFTEDCAEKEIHTTVTVSNLKKRDKVRFNDLEHVQQV